MTTITGPVLLSLLLLAPGVSAAAAEDFADRVDRAVAAGDLEDLQELRRDLRSRLEGTFHPGLAYDLVYVDWRVGQVLQETSKKQAKKVLKEAQGYVDRVLETRRDDAEVWALRGSVIGDRITGMFSAMLLGRKASASLDKAVELDPDNPRVALQRGIGWFFTPKAFGGGVCAHRTS